LERVLCLFGLTILFTNHRSLVIFRADLRKRVLAATLMVCVCYLAGYFWAGLIAGVSAGIARQGPDASSPNHCLPEQTKRCFRPSKTQEKRSIYDRVAFPVRATLEDRQSLMTAMCEGRIRPYYQPKVYLVTGEIIGFEALSRCHHPTNGLLPPSQFLPMIKEFILQSAFMIHTAVRVMQDLSKIVEKGLDLGQKPINVWEVTTATLLGRKDLFAILDRYPAQRPYLTFETTEDICIARSIDIIRQSINLLRQAGQFATAVKPLHAAV